MRRTDTKAVQRKPADAPLRAGLLLRRRPSVSVIPAPSMTPPVVQDVLSTPGSPMEPGPRALMESRFGHDFRAIRIHTGSEAARSARAVNALAYTVGEHIVFGEGQYAPHTPHGQYLLAHELAHAMQDRLVSAPSSTALEIGERQAPEEVDAEALAFSALSQDTGGEAGAPWAALGIQTMAPGLTGTRRLRRAYFDVGPLRIMIDYGDIIHIPATDYVTAIETRFAAWAGSPASTIHAALSVLGSPQVRWVMFALDVLADNTTPAHSRLDRTLAVQRLIDFAPSASTTPLGGGAVFAFEHEALRAAGWFEVALAAPLTAPTGTTLADITEKYNPPPGPSAPPGGALDAARLAADLPPALLSFLTARDPAGFAATGTHPLATLRAIADDIQAEARAFFSPYADTAISTAYARGWSYSAQLLPTSAFTPDAALREAFMLNRAEIVGRADRLGGSIFANANFDSSRAADEAALNGIVTSMLADPTTEAMVDRIIQQTARTRRGPGPEEVFIPTTFEATGTTECRARWKAIETLAHELVHVLVHPAFPARASSVTHGLVVREGFTEVLGDQLYVRLRARALGESAFRSRMESGLAVVCPTPAGPTLGYGVAGAAAERIRTWVGNSNFRAAYFLGAVDLVGL